MNNKDQVTRENEKTFADEELTGVTGGILEEYADVTRQEDEELENTRGKGGCGRP